MFILIYEQASYFGTSEGVFEALCVEKALAD
jgi:hypothetical protein